MSAIQDMAKELQAEAELNQGFSSTRSSPVARVVDWFDNLALARKIRMIMSAFTLLVVASALVIGVGLNNLYGRTMVSSELKAAIVGTADLKGEWSSLRYNTVRFLLGSEEAALERIHSSQQTFLTDLQPIEKSVDAYAPELSDQVDELRNDLQVYGTTFEELRASLVSNGRDGRTTSIAYELSGQGDKIYGELESFQADLQGHVQADEEAGLSYFFSLVNIMLVLAVGAALTLFVGMRYLAGNFSGKIHEIANGMTRLAKGDRNFHIDGGDRQDEIGEMLAAIELFKRANIRLETMANERAEQAEMELQRQQEREREREELEARKAAMIAEISAKFESQVGDVISGVAAASSQLKSTASSMAHSAEESTRRTAEVSKSMEEANAGATAAAAASDEFAMSIGEISRQAASSAELARVATDSANKADVTISALSDSAEQVGQIVELIQTIAQRTNLLALNASIEAARGGEAGRGFAVVASEVKELAMQTSRATEKVAEQIRTMQDTTGESVSALRTIADQVQQLETTAVSIASAVDQQSVAGQDLARSIDLAARSTDRVSSHIEDVRELSLATGAAAAQVLSSASELEVQASELSTQMDAFLKKVTAD